VRTGVEAHESGRSGGARRLLLESVMPIATLPPTKNDSHDAPLAPAVTQDELTRRKEAPIEPLDAASQDPYDNVACTD
jgi:hypothetical protein